MVTVAPLTLVLEVDPGVGQEKGPYTQVLEGGSRGRSGKGAFNSGIRGWVQG